MKILVTGGAGYIGSITTRVLVEAGHHVVVLDGLEKGFAPAVDPGAELVVATVDDDEV
ncbi:MAG TPA: NAD-dependent epimerase/dehydratase family protein, partial [Thermoleophilia bacterium]